MFVAIVILVLVVAIYCYNRDKVWMWLAFLVSIDKGDRGIEKMLDGLLRFNPGNSRSNDRFLNRLRGLKKRLNKHRTRISATCLMNAIARIEEKENQLIRNLYF